MATATYREMQDWFHRLALLQRTGVDVRTTVRQIKDSCHGRSREHWAAIETELSQGRMLYEAMKRQHPFFPGLAVSLVEAGERGGRLEQAADRLSRYYQALLDLRKRFFASIAWPLFEGSMAVLIVGALILILGWISTVTQSPPLDLFGLGWSTRQYFSAYLFLVLGSLAGGWFVYHALSKGWLGRTPLEIARRIPLVGRTIEMMALSRVAWALATAWEAGLDAIESVRIGLRSTQQWYYMQHHETIEQDIRRGRTLHQSLRGTRAFPVDFLQTIDVGELSGTIPESLEQLSSRYEDEIQRNLGTLSTIGGVLIMLLIFLSAGCLIVYLYYTIYFKPLMELQNGL